MRMRKYYASCFFCQQSAEKALKAVHIQVKRELAPRTHNLIELGRRLKVPSKLAANLVELNPEFVVTRYPNAANAAPVDVYTREIAKLHYRKAKEVLGWARSRISR